MNSNLSFSFSFLFGIVKEQGFHMISKEAVVSNTQC